MIIPRQMGPVGEWVFEDRAVHRLNWSSLQESLATCETVVSILRGRKLFFPHSVRLSQWMKAGEQGVAQSQRINKTEIDLTVDHSDLFAPLLTTCRSTMDNELAYPLTIEFFGSGVVITSAGDQLVPDLIWLQATTLEILRISVNTQSDVWLPFSLEGKDQDYLYRLNSDRLADALHEIQGQTRMNLEAGVESHYSVIKGFRLENRRYADGSLETIP